MIDISITSTQLPRIQGRLGRWAATIADLTPFWRDVFAPRYLADIQENFEQSGALVGGWPPLSPGYAAWKAVKWGAHLGILELSLRLRGSLQWLGTDIGPEGIFRPTASSVTIGTSVPYAARHHRGIGVPQRRVLFTRNEEAYGDLWRGWVLDRWTATQDGV